MYLFLRDITLQSHDPAETHDPNDTIRELLGPINTFSGVGGDKLNIQKSTAIYQ